MASRAEQLRNITPEQCVTLAIDFLTRTTETVRNPLPGGRSLNTNAQTFISLSNACLAHPTLARLNERVQEERRGQVLWSPYARENNPNAPHGDIELLTQDIIAATTGLAPPPVAPTRSRTQSRTQTHTHTTSPTRAEVAQGIVAARAARATRTPDTPNRVLPSLPEQATTQTQTRVTDRQRTAAEREQQRQQRAAEQRQRAAEQQQRPPTAAEQRQRIMDEIRTSLRPGVTVTDLVRSPRFLVLTRNQQETIARELYEITLNNPNEVIRYNLVNYQASASPPEVSPKRRSNVSSKSLTSDESLNLNEMCKTRFRGIQIPETNHGRNVKPFLNKLKKVCHKVVDKAGCDLNGLSGRIQELKVKLNNRMQQTFNAIQGTELEYLFHNWTNNTNVLRTPIDFFTVNYENTNGQAIDVGGPRRHFFQSVAEQVISKHLLVQTEDASDAYNFNYNFDISFLGMTDTPDNRNIVFTFFGALISWMMINGFNLRGHLNRAILANLLYKDNETNSDDNELTDDDYALFYMLDYPDMGGSLARFMLTPEMIEDSMVVFNDGDINLIPSISEDDPDNTVSSRTYRKYMGFMGRYSLIGKDFPALIAFKKGFYIGRRYLRNRNFTISQLDSLITTIEITDEQLNEIVKSIQDVSPRNRKPIIIDWFCSIVKGQVRMPVTRWSPEERSLLPLNHKREFLPRLLKWFSGSQNYQPGRPYSVSIVIGNEGTLPVAHTCSFIIDIASTVTSAEDLMYKLVTSMISTEKDFQLA